MADKGGGFWDNPFGGLFDFNGDGKEDFGEQFIGHKIFDDVTNAGKNDSVLGGFSLDSDEDDADRYAWRDFCDDGTEYGLDPEDYETEEEYNEALKKRRRRKLQKQRKSELSEDKTIYTYCGVMLPFSGRPYHFRAQDDTIKIGDTVVVPVGEENNEMEGIVVSVGKYARLGVPFPVEQTKFVLRKSAAD